jgi:hypothetical protein
LTAPDKVLTFAVPWMRRVGDSGAPFGAIDLRAPQLVLLTDQGRPSRPGTDPEMLVEAVAKEMFAVMRRPVTEAVNNLSGAINAESIREAQIGDADVHRSKETRQWACSTHSKTLAD